MPSRLCLTPRCPNPATSRGRCADHAREQERNTKRAGRRIYATKRWKLLRRRVLFEEPLCRVEGCELLSTDADHVVAIEDGGEPFSRANVQGLCPTHHGQKTRREQMSRGKGRVAAA